MVASHLNKIAAIALVAALSACASPPKRIDNLCSVFQQNAGWVGNWQNAAHAASRKYGIPVPVLMATIRMESGFDGRARPPRTTLLGFIPWKRQSTAYGYSQALDGTWEDYRRLTGNRGARRSNFAHAVDFVGWYHSRSVKELGIAPTDTYNLYLAYYSGHGGYRRGTWRNNASIQNYARRTAEMANRYATQMRQCG